MPEIIFTPDSPLSAEEELEIAKQEVANMMDRDAALAEKIQGKTWVQIFTMLGYN